jgi:hypothetical protein
VLLIACEEVIRVAPSNVSSGDRLVVEEVEVSIERDDGNEEWRISNTPVLSVGVVEGEDPYVLERVLAARRAPGGGVLILDSRSAPRLMAFDRTGKFTRYLAQYGEGPAELKGFPILFGYRADSLAVWDDLLSRITVFAAHGDVGRTLRISSVLGMRHLSVRQALPDGGFLLIRGSYSPELPMRKDGWEQTTALRIDEAGALVDSIGEFPMLETEVNALGHSVAIGLGGRGAFLPAHEGFVWYRTDVGEFRYFGVGGALERIVRLKGMRRPVTEEVWRQYLREQREEMLQRMSEGSVARSLSVLESRPRALLTPLLTRAFVAEDRILWIQPFRMRPAEDQVLLRVDLQDRSVVSLKVPNHSRVHQVDDEYLLLARTGELGTDVVELYQLRSSAEGL